MSDNNANYYCYYYDYYVFPPQLLFLSHLPGFLTIASAPGPLYCRFATTMNTPRLMEERLHKAGWDGGWRRGHGSREDRGEGKGHRKQDERTVSGLVSQKPVELFPYLSSLSIYLNLIFSNVYHI